MSIQSAPPTEIFDSLSRGDTLTYGKVLDVACGTGCTLKLLSS